MSGAPERRRRTTGRSILQGSHRLAPNSLDRLQCDMYDKIENISICVFF